MTREEAYSAKDAAWRAKNTRDYVAAEQGVSRSHAITAAMTRGETARIARGYALISELEAAHRAHLAWLYERLAAGEDITIEAAPPPDEEAARYIR